MLPLANRRILVTRSRTQASELASRLEAEGAIPIVVPTIEIVPPASYQSLDDAIARLHHFDWVVFTSANAVEAFQNRAALHGSHTSAHVLTAVIGPATARAATAIGLKVALIPEKAVAESLATALIHQITPKTKILLIRATTARDELPRALLQAGAAVEIAEAYTTVVPDEATQRIQALFARRSDWPDAITFTSSSTANNLVSLLAATDLHLPRTIIRASIGPITSNTLRNLDLPPHFEASEANIQSLVQGLIEYLQSNERG